MSRRTPTPTGARAHGGGGGGQKVRRERRGHRFFIYIPLLQRERDNPIRRLGVSPEAEALALGTFLDGPEEENDAGAPAAAGSSHFCHGPCLRLLREVAPGENLIGCGINQAPRGRCGLSLLGMQRELSRGSWLKGLIDKRARGDMPIAQFDDGPGGIPVRAFKAGADEKYGTNSVYLAFGKNRPLNNVAREYLEGAAEAQRH